jgi:predicted RND superfamily exporter protein
VNDLNQYSRNVNAVQTEIERNITSLSMQNDTNQLLLKQEQQGIKDMEALAKTFAEATDRIGGLIRQSDRNNEEYMKRLTEAVQELKTSLERQPSRGRRLF